MKADYLAGGDEELLKIGASLLEARRAEIDGASAKAAAEQYAGSVLRSGKIQVNIVHTPGTGDSLAALVRSLGIEVYRVFPEYNTITARVVSATELEPIARRPEVLSVDPEPTPLLRTGATTTQGDASMHADQARAAFNATGAQVKVGILSDSIHKVIGGNLTNGFLSGSTSQNSGDLPASIRVIEESGSGGTDEGAAMAEIVHDLAPGADIMFATAFNSYLGFAGNITDLVNAGADVIVDDVIYFQEPMYQDGPIAESVRKAVEAGVAYFSAAGNNADYAHERAFTDHSSTNDSASPPSGNDLHNFSGSTTFLRVRLPKDSTIAAILHWDEPYGGSAASGPGASSDLDLYLTKSNSTPITNANIVAKSFNRQGTISSPKGDAFEFIQYKNTGSTATFYFSIDRYNDPPAANNPSRVSLVLFFDGSTTIQDTSFAGARTLYGHASAPGAVAVAAMRYNAMAGSAPYLVEYFSSLGGALPFVFSAGGSRLPSVITRQQPLITAADGGNTSFFGQDFDAGGTDGFPNFFGTSAAAPHAGAVAALILERNRLLKPAGISEIMQLAAVDSESGGFDNLSGAGWVDALKALNMNLNDPLGVAAPTKMIVGQQLPIGVTSKNTGTSTWTRAGQYQLGITNDPCGLFGGVARVPLPDGTDSVLPNAAPTFLPAAKAPATPGQCGFSLRMVQEGVAFFGPEYFGQIEVGPAFEVDYGQGAAGWFGGIVSGGTTVVRSASGLCMTVPLAGDNIVGWVSPERYAPLIDRTAFRARVTASTNATAVDTIPVWTMLYDNFPFLTYGGETIVIDVAGGANGIGRPQGRTSFEFWPMPNAVNTQQWRGALANGVPGENDQSAFSPAADTQNDMRLVFRELDMASAGVNSALDAGMICVRNLHIEAISLDAIAAAETIFAPALSNTTHGAETFDQMGGGFAQIDDGAATANFQLAAGGLGSRKTLFPWDQTGGSPAPFHPASWTTDALYRGTLRVRSNVAGGSEGGDPLDTLTIAFDTKTIELVTTSVTLRGTPGSMRFAASPRLTSTTGGSAQTYTAFFYAHNRTTLNPAIDPEAGRWRMLGDFANYPEIAPEGQGSDPFSVEEMRIERVTAP